MKTFLPVALLLFAPIAWADDAPAPDTVRICQFSLNNEDEFTATKDFVDKINKNSATKIEIQEFMPEGANPDQAFKAMVDSGVHCDGLVISGHHTGSYGGARTKGHGKLSMDFMESLSCDPKNEQFFRNINAAWLQGCRTLGVGEIEANDDLQDADFNTNRVGNTVDEDGLTQNFSELNMEFSNTLDQDNPLASRYLRLLPNAKLFGWTRSAPGEKSHSYMSVMYHMAQMARLLDAEDKYPFDAPDAKQMSPASAAKFADAMLVALHHFGTEESSCDSLAVSGWLAQGGVGNPGHYYFDNTDLKSYAPLTSSGDSSLLEAKSLDCQLKAAAKRKDLTAMQNLLDGMAQRPEFLRYSFNTLMDLRSSMANAKDPESKKVGAAILDYMKSDSKVTDFLKNKMTSRQVGFLRKVDYYKFYNLLTGEKDPAVEKDLHDRSLAILSAPLPPLDPNAAHPARSRQLAASYRATIFQSMVKNHLAAPDFYQELMAHHPDDDVVASVQRFSPSSVSTLPGTSIPTPNLPNPGDVLQGIGNFFGIGH